MRSYHLVWQTSDLPDNHAAIQSWIDDSALENVLPPLALDVRNDWPSQQFDLLFSANSLHIMSDTAAEQFIRRAPGCMHDASLLMVYGPFNYGGQYTAHSNARFDHWLKQRDPASGIKDYAWLEGIAQQAGLAITDDVAMPANNRILTFKKLNLKETD